MTDRPPRNDEFEVTFDYESQRMAGGRSDVLIAARSSAKAGSAPAPSSHAANAAPAVAPATGIGTTLAMRIPFRSMTKVSRRWRTLASTSPRVRASSVALIVYSMMLARNRASRCRLEKR